MVMKMCSTAVLVDDPAAPSRAGARSDAAVGAWAGVEQELHALAAQASTAVEHWALHDHFEALAKRYLAIAWNHLAVADSYRRTGLPQAAVLHERLARVAHAGVDDVMATAEAHERLACLSS
jgi:hypothetical protein